MNTFRGWHALLLCAALAACGGGDDTDAAAEVAVGPDAVNGTFGLCTANADGVTSGQVVLAFDDTSATLSMRQYLGTRCRGPAFVSIRFPLVLITGGGSRNVAGPSGGPVAAVRFSASSGGGSVTVETGSEYVRFVDGQVQVVAPGTGIVLYADDVVQAAYTNQRDLRVNVGGQLYFGRSDGPVDADGYPGTVDYTTPWQRL